MNVKFNSNQISGPSRGTTFNTAKLRRKEQLLVILLLTSEEETFSSEIFRWCMFLATSLTRLVRKHRQYYPLGDHERDLPWSPHFQALLRRFHLSNKGTLRAQMPMVVWIPGIYLFMGYRNSRSTPRAEVQIQWKKDQGRIYDLQWVSVANLAVTDVKWRIATLMVIKSGKEF